MVCRVMATNVSVDLDKTTVVFALNVLTHNGRVDRSFYYNVLIVYHKMRGRLFGRKETIRHFRVSPISSVEEYLQKINK